MTLKVLLFGPQAIMVSNRDVTLELPGGEATVEQILSALSEAAPAIADSLSTSRLAVNHEFAAPEQNVTVGDEVALIGMVSGG
jgi:molybdopterin converting factor small subunit